MDGFLSAALTWIMDVDTYLFGRYPTEELRKIQAYRDKALFMWGKL